MAETHLTHPESKGSDFVLIDPPDETLDAYKSMGWKVFDPSKKAGSSGKES